MFKQNPKHEYWSMYSSGIHEVRELALNLFVGANTRKYYSVLKSNLKSVKFIKNALLQNITFI